MKCGIVGPPLSGKSTLFNILTGSPVPDEFTGTKREPRRGIARMIDPRLEALGRISDSRKTTPATVEYIDIPGIESRDSREPYPPRYLSELGGVDMLAMVLREFENETVPHPAGSIDPARDLNDASLEFIINDLTIIERRLEKLRKQHDKDSGLEAEILDRCISSLSDEIPLREIDFTPSDSKLLRGYSLLSIKPLLVVLNLGEATAPGAPEHLEKLRGQAASLSNNAGWVAVAAGIEAEISAMDEDDRGDFLDDLGFELPALDRIIRATFELLRLITFLTTSEKETRAWSIPSGSTALQAAGTVHDDMARGFIRAEVCAWDDLSEAGSFSRLKETGKLRLEGRDYIVRDGDIIQVRFSV